MSGRSRHPGPTKTSPFRLLPSQSTPGPMGKNDYADPVYWLGAAFRFVVFGDTPGPVGINDHAAPASNRKNPILNDVVWGLDLGPIKVDIAGPLQVSQGQVTFDAEGNDDRSSPYFSRVVQWPGNDASGVTLGRGYDMGNRTEAEVTADLTAAGVPADKAKEFAKGAGPANKGVKAGQFVKDNKTKLGELSLQAQKSLFERTYPKYVEAARTNYERWTTGSDGKSLAGKVEWEKLDPAIRDILVDFVYQGFTKGPNPMVKGMKNDFDELINYIQNSSELSQYEAGRKRVVYLKSKRPKPPSTAAKPDLL